ncbi:MAG: class I SAM-dependent methyltransferase [Candidatus Paceibacterota bacterium]
MIFFKRKQSVKGYSKESDQPYFKSTVLNTQGRREGVDISTRFRGLEEIATTTICKNATLLDLGCAEGLISYEFFKKGIRLIHGFDIQDISITLANELFEKEKDNLSFEFRQADINDWGKFEHENADLLLPSYDIVLFLGVFHHLNEQDAKNTLQNIIKRTKTYLAIRTNDLLPRAMIDSEFDQIPVMNQDTNTGQLSIFKRR